MVECFIVGAPKAGTTSVYDFLVQNGCYSRLFWKEPNYFCHDEYNADFVREVRCRKDRHYSIVEAKEEYLRGVEEGQGYIDSSTDYLLSKGAYKRIKEYNPNAKIIICLRDPIERAISQFQMHRSLGLMKEPLGDALHRSILEYHEFGGRLDSRFNLFAASNYFPGIENYITTFGRENVYVVVFERLVAAPNEQLIKLLKFLGKSDAKTMLPRSNEGSNFNLLYRVLRQNELLVRAYKLLGPGVREGIRELMKTPRSTNTVDNVPLEFLELRKRYNSTYGS